MDINLEFLLQIREMININRRFRQEHIALVFLKGLLEEYYLTGSLPRRPPLDIDILIGKKDFPSAAKIFKSQNYRLMLENPDEVFSITEGMKKSQLNAVKFFGEIKIIFDIHLLVLIPTGIIANVLPATLSQRISNRIIGRRDFIKFKSGYFPIPKNEDILIHRLLNFFFHHSCRGSAQLKKISDIINCLRLDWSEIVTLLKTDGLAESAYYPLFLAKQIYRAPVPAGVLASLRPGGRYSLMRTIMFSPKTVNRPIENLFLRRWFNVCQRIALADNPLKFMFQAIDFLTLRRKFLKKLGRK